MAAIALARVKITVELRLSQPWPGHATVEEAYQSAAKQALEEVRRLEGVTIVGQPEVAIITFERTL